MANTTDGRSAVGTKMANSRMILGTCLMLTSLSIGQTLTGVVGVDTGSTLNKEFLRQRHTEATNNIQPQSGTIRPKVVVFPGDRVVAQFVDGGGWKTSLFFVNLENHPVSFQVLFFQDNGNDMFVPIAGVGSVRQVNIALDTAGSIEFETAGFANSLSQGWALLSQTTLDTIGGMAVFRQHVFGRQDQEAVVPIVSQFDSHFVLLFDNTAFTTGIAIANPTLNFVDIPVNIRNQAGQIIDQQIISLAPYSHTAFSLSDTWFSTAGRIGAIEFQTSGFGVAALGLRFNGSAFTSFNVLENINWR
jgi:hypothetical protein